MRTSEKSKRVYWELAKQAINLNNKFELGYPRQFRTWWKAVIDPSKQITLRFELQSSSGYLVSLIKIVEVSSSGFAPRQSLKASQFSEGELSPLLCPRLLSPMSPNALRICTCNGLLDDSVVQSSLETFASERRRKPRADTFEHSWWHCIAILSSKKPEVGSAFRFCICKPLVSPPEVKNIPESEGMAIYLLYKIVKLFKLP